MTNSKSTKRALASSILATFMCVAMLVGMTFAWFTDTASTGVNTIKSGNLAVEIQNEEGSEISSLEWTAIDGRAQDKILWEPGATYNLTPFKIVNVGNLALKYKLVVTGLDGDSELLDVIKFTYTDANGAAFDLNEERTLLPEEGRNSSGMITVSAAMDKNAGNDYMNKELNGIEIKVYATQYTYEKDSKDDQYDKDAGYPVIVTPDTAASVDYSKSNAVYQFAAGNYSGLSLNIGKNTDVVFEADEGATFDNVTIGYKVNRYNETDKSDNTMRIRGFKVTGVLSVNSAEGNLIIEDNTAQQLKVVMNRMDGKDNANIQIKNNKLNGGKYGIEFVPNHSKYTLDVIGNEFSNITSNAISVMGYQSDLAATDATRTAAKAITIKNNTFNSYGASKAAFKIWGDINLAPTKNCTLSDAANELATNIKGNNTFVSLDSTCVVADFFDTQVPFN